MSEPFAAIPLAWLKSKDPYHRFLLWIIPEIAGVDGFGGLQAGQVRFSRRDIELGLSVGSTQATGFIKRAVCDGLLKSTQNYSRRKGMGEVYDTDGDLLATRQNAQTNSKPRTNQQRTNQVSECLDLCVDANQEQTNSKPRANRLIDKTKKTKKDSTPSEGKETVSSILQWDNLDYSSMFWTTFKPWPANRRVNNITLAKRYRDALRSGVDATALYMAVKTYSESCKPEYMKEAAAWMAEEGWRAYEVGDAAQV